MPCRIRFDLTGPAPASPFQHSRGLHRIVLELLEEGHPGLGAVLHDSNQPAPVNISPIRRCRNGLYFDVNLLADWLLEALVVSCSEERDIRLGNVHYHLGIPEMEEYQSWEDMLDAPEQNSYRFHLLSPTAHHSSGTIRKVIPLPTPELYFGSWLNRWNLCCERRIDSSLTEILSQRLAVSECHGRTVKIGDIANRVFVGFMGEVCITLLKPCEMKEEHRRELAALARFSTFCGTGVETMRGMGQTRMLCREGE